MSGLEQTVSRVLASAGTKLFGKASQIRLRRQLRNDTRTLVATRVADSLLRELDAAQAHHLHEYLASPDFEEVALQLVLGTALKDVPWEQVRIDVRDEIRHGLRTVARLPPELLTTTADVVFDALASAAEPMSFPATGLNPTAIASSAHLAAAAAANSTLLRQLGDLAQVHGFAEDLRAQVVAVHGHMRLPHLGVSRSVPYEQLYVAPSLRPHQEQQTVPDLAALALPGRRSVILGDPGAGKSTLAAKLAHDVAAGLVPGAEDRVPFLLVLREFAGSFRDGRLELARYLEQVCRAPYNLDPPQHAVEYLLRNGRATVVLDGLDELVDPELRRRFVQLVDGFVSRFPLVPILVTARRIGYLDAPLDHQTFTVGVVAELNEEQVTQYSERWFALDAATADADRSRMAAAFLRESANITDLRANPLLLALLCAMYSSEHYIPTNLAQVYERCALMLFDRWDVMRGIAESPQFVGRLRGAVQHLAWHMFRAEHSGRPLPQHRIVRLLVDHLVAKKFDEDDAIATAEEFVEFCTGRAWILSDVGATEVEPRFGFTHRTFMEYFAAEHLVRTHSSADRLWGQLRPRVSLGEWEVVAQIALQLLDRNVEGGADDLLRLVLDDARRNENRASRLRDFAARALGHVHPGHDVVREVTSAALQNTLAVDVGDRYHFWPDASILRPLMERDEALHTLMYRSSPGNFRIIEKTVRQDLSEHVERGNDPATFVLLNLGRRLLDADLSIAQTWSDTRRQLWSEHEQELARWRRRAPWWDIYHNRELARMVHDFGPATLYLSDYFLTGSLGSSAERLLSVPDELENSSDLIAALLTTPRPWITDARWWHQFGNTRASRFENVVEQGTWTNAALPLVTLLYLPYLETHRFTARARLPRKRIPVLRELALAREEKESSSDLHSGLTQLSFPEDVRAFLTSWTEEEFSVLSPHP